MKKILSILLILTVALIIPAAGRTGDDSYQYGQVAISIESAEAMYAGSKVALSVDVKLTNETKGVLICVVYVNNTLLGTKTKDITEESLLDQNFDFSLKPFASYIVKVFLWDSLDTMWPLCPFVSSTVEPYILNFYAETPLIIYSGRYNESAAQTVFMENEIGEWLTGGQIKFRLTDKYGSILDNNVKFANVNINNVSSITNLSSGIYENTGATGGAVYVTDYEFVANGLSAGAEEAKMVFTPSLSVNSNFTGDIYLSCTVDGSNEILPRIKIAQAKAPFSILTGSAAIQSGNMYSKATDIILKEDAPGALPAGGYVTFSIGTPYINNEILFDVISASDIVTDNNELKISVYDAQPQIGFLVERSSSTRPANITVDNLHIVLDRSLSVGSYSLHVGSMGENGWVQNFWNAEGIENSEKPDPGYFSDNIMTVDNYVTVYSEISESSPLNRNCILKADSTTIVIDDNFIEISSLPYIDTETGLLMIPVRNVLVALGFSDSSIIWDPVDKALTILNPGNIVQFKKDSSEYVANANRYTAIEIINGEEVILRPVVDSYNNQLYVPFGLFSQAFGVPVLWNSSTQTLYINPTSEQISSQ